MEPRNFVTTQEIEKATQVDLLTYLKICEPDNLVKSGYRNYRHKEFSSLVIGEQFWDWKAHGIGGYNAVRYLDKVRGLGFVRAVQQVNEAINPAALSSFQLIKTSSPAVSDDSDRLALFELPPADTTMHEVFGYLRSRGISPDIIDYCKQSGILYQSSIRNFKNCVFVGKDETGTAKSACIRGRYSGSGQYRWEVLGSDKSCPFAIMPNRPSTVLEIYEAPIDAMSGASLAQMEQGDGWKSVHYISLGGYNHKAIERYLHWHPEIDTLRLRFDNDEAGRRYVQKVLEKFGDRALIIEDLPPTYGKDYNDTLLAVISASRGVTKSRQRSMPKKTMDIVL